MHISIFRDGVTSSIETKTSAFISSELISFDLAAEPTSITNSAPGPQTASSELDGTSLVAYVPYAQTMCVDDNSCHSCLCCNGSNGHFACATTSTFYSKTFTPGAPSSMLFGGINPNAEMYFGNATASYGPSVIATIHLSTPYVNVISMGPTLTTAVSTEGEFVSAMRKRAQAEAPSPTALIGSSKSDFGYVLPFFIKFLANQSKYAAQYPQIASCLPVGPSIDPSLKQIALASNPDIDSDLSSIITKYYPPRWVLGSRFD